MSKLTLDDRIVATSYGLGPFHPAIANDRTIHHWPNITFHTEDEAIDWAVECVKQLQAAVDDIANDWNTYGVRI